MKLHYKILSCLMICLLLGTTVSAQVAVGTYDMQFVESCQGPQYCVNLQIKSATAGQTFYIGSYTAFFDYNQAAIDNPVYSGINFDDLHNCAAGGTTAPYYAPQFSTQFNSLTGKTDLNLTTLMSMSGLGCPLVTDQWMDVGQFCFDVVDDGQTTSISFDAGLTIVNKNDDTPEHTQGTLTGLDANPVCPCVDFVVYENISTLPALTEVSQYITAGNYGVGDVVVLNGQDIDFVAGDYISLDPGFYTESGALFSANIDVVAPCAPPAAKTELEEPLSEHLRKDFIAFPNPFEEEVSVAYVLNEETKVNLALFDMSGKQIRTLISDEIQASGTHKVTFNYCNLPSGFYFCALQTPSEKRVIKLVKN